MLFYRFPVSITGNDKSGRYFQMTLKEITEILDGHLKGDPSIEIKGVAGIDEAVKGQITYFKDTKKHKELLTQATALIVSDEIPQLKKAQIIVPNPHLAFAKLLKVFHVKPVKALGVMEGSFISDNVKLGKEVSIYPGVFISDNVKIGDRTYIYPGVFAGENTVIGNDCIIYPNVTIGENLKIGDQVIIHSGTTIGSDGFGYILDKGSHFKIPQVGGVIIESNVEIGSNVSIDRATTGNTIIGEGTKIDNLVQIAHNVKIGKNSIIVAQVGIAGSSRIGDYVVLAGQVGVKDHIEIESYCKIGAQSGIMNNLKKGSYFGSPAMPHIQFLKSQAIFNRLPEIDKKLKELEKKIDALYKGRG